MRFKYKKNIHKKINLLVLVLLFEFIFPQHSTLAQSITNADINDTAPIIDVIKNDNTVNDSDPIIEIEHFPIAKDRVIIKTMRVVATAYSSTVGQTDSTPFISASGDHVFDGMIAANFLKFGTKVRLPDLYGEKQFVVLDRMNQRFSQRIDVWMDSYSKAKNFGVRHVRIEIIR